MAPEGVGAFFRCEPGWRKGRRRGLKIPWGKPHAGSSPAPGICYWRPLSYRGTIAPRDEFFYEGGSFTDVYVADMNLSWGFDDGTFVLVSVAG